jgi:hypothetical protein
MIYKYYKKEREITSDFWCMKRIRPVLFELVAFNIKIMVKCRNTK